MNPLCKCHAEPQYWERDARYRKGGFWRCSVRRRDRNNKSYFLVGWRTKRRRDLRTQRSSVLNRLEALDA